MLLQSVFVLLQITTRWGFLFVGNTALITLEERCVRLNTLDPCPNQNPCSKVGRLADIAGVQHNPAGSPARMIDY